MVVRGVVRRRNRCRGRGQEEKMQRDIRNRCEQVSLFRLICYMPLRVSEEASEEARQCEGELEEDGGYKYVKLFEK